MQLTRRFFMLCALAATLTLAACPKNPAPTEIYLVRHAEKLTGDDPALSPAGIARADALAERLRYVSLTDIYTTDYKRTRDTAAPIARQAGLEPRLYDPRRLQEFAETLRKTKGRILVVGHSNTTPQLVELLGGDPVSQIDEASEYDRFYIVTLNRDGSVDSELRRYGARYQPAE